MTTDLLVSIVIPILNEEDNIPVIVDAAAELPPLGNLKKFHYEIINDKINEELKKLPIEIDPSVKEDYKEAYYSNPLTFSEYLNIENYYFSTKLTMKNIQTGSHTIMDVSGIKYNIDLSDDYFTKDSLVNP